MDDKYSALEKIYKKRIEEIKKYTYEQLINLCKIENLDYNDMNEEEIRKAIINFYNEELED